jgi:replicative DNA helicase
MSFAEKIKQQLLLEDFNPGKDFFENPDDYEKEIMTGIKWDVTKYGHKRLDEHCPFKQGQLTTIVGHSNVGKTTLIVYLLSRLVRNKKIMIYSAENKVSQLARLLLGFTFETDQHSRYFEFLRKQVLFIKHVKQYTYRDILEQIGIAEDIGFKPDVVFIDPYNSLKKDRRLNSHEYDYEAIEDFRIFCKNTGISIFLNCHTVTESQRVKPDKNGEVPRPMASDTEGGGKFINKSDDVMVIHRNLYAMDTDERYVSLLFIDKVRNTEGGGFPTSYQDPIRFTFRKDWTGFDTAEDRIRKILEPQNDLPF